MLDSYAARSSSKRLDVHLDLSSVGRLRGADQACVRQCQHPCELGGRIRPMGSGAITTPVAAFDAAFSCRNWNSRTRTRAITSGDRSISGGRLVSVAAISGEERAQQRPPDSTCFHRTNSAVSASLRDPTRAASRQHGRRPTSSHAPSPRQRQRSRRSRCRRQACASERRQSRSRRNPFFAYLDDDVALGPRSPSQGSGHRRDCRS